VERYLHKSRQLRRVFLLVDIRHAPSENDRMMYKWICGNGYHPLIIATKLDKEAVTIPFSATTKQGREEIYELLDNILLEENE